ncbi:MAG: EF-hand domain-containing protein, partial [Candidatus Thermoplasmatota archaeon]|nr:EF-hand domain-containing protein [Candidatus Thermoplasmatota archaeon]
MTASDVVPTVLVVDSNPMNVLRLTELLQGRGFEVSVCDDGDLAVDEYIRLDPELVVLALDLPSLDGHLAALEMREHGGDERIMFVAPRRMLALAKDAGFSAGAVAVLEKPVTRSALDAVWAAVEGPIPAAPGLDDIEELYPDRGPPPLDLPLPDLPLPPLPAVVVDGELPPLPAAPKAKPQVYTEDELRVVFTEIDTDNSGDIDFAELKVALNGMSAVGSKMSDAEVKKMLNLGDTDGDARVSFDEYNKIVTGEVTPPTKNRRWGRRLFALVVLAALGG